MKRPINLKTLVFTGPESSGKTWLSNYFSKKFDLPLIPEYSRIYLNRFGPSYEYPDLMKIALGQLQIEKTVDSESSNLILMDTDLMTLKIWSEYVFGKCDPFIIDTIKEINDRHYLLCKPDIPWESDPLRENPIDRDKLFINYQETLEYFNQSYTIISGDFKSRTSLSDIIIKMFLSK